MADFNKLKDTIRGAIYPNGRGAISADKHQAALLDMADTMQETDTKVTELSAEIAIKLDNHESRINVLEDKTDFTIMSEAEYEILIEKEDKLYFLYED